jgi:ribosomal protein S18 acetylase RimI-like enzyme
MEYRLTIASPFDTEWLDDLRRRVYLELFQATWGGWDEARHVRHFSECIERGQISIIEVDGVPVGMVQLFDDPDAVEIGEIQVEPRSQNRGIGTRVLIDIIADADRRRKSVRLYVGLKNDNAFRLYQRLGFRQVARTETHDFMEHEPVVA